MAFENTRFTLMCFPQSIDASGKLSINIVFLPRNISPLDKVSTVHNPPTMKSEAFVNVKPQFDIRVVNDPTEFAGKVPANEKILATAALAYPTQIAELYKTLKDAKTPDMKPKYFDIDESRSSDRATGQRAPAATDKASAIRKYLPVSYRASFNFTGLRVPNAVTDDSYHCAMRDQQTPAAIVVDNKISWGKVYAHLLRQPLMAMAGGLLYKTSVQLTPGDYAKGGWLYVDIKAGTTYATEQATSIVGAGDHFIKRYAARIPVLKAGEARSLFASVLFPVMETGANPTGIYDDLFIEAARFNDGFATIVHANQPVSQNLLQEEQDGFHPQKEIGIRLGWEDEQLLIWYLRQLGKDETANNDRLDAPLGVMGYHVDVRKSGESKWESLTAVKSNGSLQLEHIAIGNYEGELPFQVYPTKLYGINSNQFWLPMYFANWNDTSLVQPDKTAAEIYQNDKDKNKPVKVSNTYAAIPATTRLRYGNSYEFRVRLSDISGGGPTPGVANPPKELPSHIASTPFKRYVAPHSVRVLNKRVMVSLEQPAVGGPDDILVSTDDDNFSGTTLRFARPVLGWPAVEYTGKYTDAVARLKAAAVAGVKEGTAFGISDPDVVKLEIHVEVETLQLDNLASSDGREHFITLYKTYRSFDAVDFDAALDVGIVYVDTPVLNLTDTVNPFKNPASNATVAATSGPIILPTARNIRITVRGVCESDEAYWGNTHMNPDRDSRYGKKTTIKVRKASADEQNLFTGQADPRFIQGIFLQPDPIKIKLNSLPFMQLQGGGDGMPNIVQRLGKQLDVEVREMTLLAENGERIQFWCSNLLRHSMAPDNSSVTFANKLELTDQWIVCTSIYLERDWSWDGLKTSSLQIHRRRKSGAEAGTIESKTPQFIGDLEMKRIASFQAIQRGKDDLVHREYTRIIIIDVVDGTPAGARHPDTVQVHYELQPSFRKNHGPIADPALQTPVLTLPATTNPRQMPKLIGAGVALSPYNRNKQYSATEARQRFLWLEFDKKPEDPNDSIFARVLSYAPDQLLSNNHPDLMELPDESPLPVDPEYIRVITPDTGSEHAGLNAMQQMEKSVDNGRHFYLLPLPAGLHGESAELFGFFTYEFRYGHTDRIWSTAQGRYGRALRVTGLQHPAPNMYAMVDRNEKAITVSAPYAQAVFNGRNVTSDPPRTAIWCLLYAQVRQADGLDYRNILLQEMELKPRPRIRHEKPFRDKIAIAIKNKDTLLATQLTTQLNQLVALEKEGKLHAHGNWLNGDVDEMLELYGLPLDSPLSVVCVEVSGVTTNMFEHFSKLDAKVADELKSTLTSTYGQGMANNVMENISAGAIKKGGSINRPDEPLTTNLGQYRILRTSPLTEVPFVCCTDCE